jgi:RNA polymerase sigma factor (sigma-70 family)
MFDSLLRQFLHALPRSLAPAGEAGLTDAELLRRFAGQRDPAAFEILTWRHAAMVLAVCRRVLRSAADVEDAFQATFLVFLHKADSVRSREAVASWLYRVAYRTALRARRSAARRASHESQAPPLAPPAAEPHDPGLRAVLDEELSRLPEKYRAPLVLCYLEDRTKEETARLLGCPAGTVSSRLARARQRLRHRLVRRGVTLSAAAIGGRLAQEGAAALPPAESVRAVLRSAGAVANGGLHAAGVPGPAAALAAEVLHGMLLARVRAVAAVVLLIVAVGTGSAAALCRPAPPDAEPARGELIARHTERPRENAAEPYANSPGYVWAVPPREILPAKRLDRGGVSGAVETDRYGALVVTLTHPPRYSKSGKPYFRPVAFDDAGRRYLLAFASGQVDDRQAVNRYRLPPATLPAAKVRHVGVEELPPEGRKRAAEHSAGLARAKGIETLPLPELGREYDFALTSTGGQRVTARGLRDKVVVIHCWAAWSAASVKQRDQLETLYRRRQADGLEVLGIDLSHSPGPKDKLVNGRRPPWPEVLVPRDLPGRELWEQASEIFALPRVLVLDRRGVLRADTPPDLDRAVAEILRDR